MRNREGCPYGMGLGVEAELSGDLVEHVGDGVEEEALAAQERECRARRRRVMVRAAPNAQPAVGWK